jgi:AraC-like DNA-binding protein
MPLQVRHRRWPPLPSPSKKEDALRLGADEVVISRNTDEMQKHAESFDFILDTISADHNINAYLNLLRRDGNLDHKEWSIQFRWLLADEVEPPVLIECCFAWVLSTARVGTGTGLSPLRVELVQPCTHVKTIERHFGCPVVCGAERNQIVFRASDAHRPFVTRNAELLTVLAPQFEEELKQENADENFPERVRLSVQQKLTGRRPTIEDIADALHVSPRTLQRRLQDDGLSFQRVLELELNEAAYLLGYEDANSFVRAFRTWEGVPPARWREIQRARAAS